MPTTERIRFDLVNLVFSESEKWQSTRPEVRREAYIWFTPQTDTMDDATDQRKQEKPNIKGDRVNILLQLFMYMVQGGTAGLTQAFPIILKNRGVSYKDQAGFSFASYPFSFKLLWAPIVDCMYSRKMGRRKSWVVPMQYLIGLLQLYVSTRLDDWLGSDDGVQKPKIRLLAITFFSMTLFNAIQDVALDSWSLSMLQRRNVGYSGACQNLGGSIGMALTSSLLILLDSKEFCNKFRVVPQDRGFVNLADFIFYWSMLVIVSTTLIFVFKKENSSEAIEDDHQHIETRLGFKESYKKLWEILQLRPVIALCLVLLTCRVGFGPMNSVAPLKMIDAGITQDSYVLLTTASLPFQVVLSVALRRWMIGPQPMHAFIVVYVLKLAAGALLAIVLFFSVYVKDEEKMLPTWFFCVLLFVFNLRNVLKYFISLSLGTFMCRISDTRFGGIYMTLWGSCINTGSNWPLTLSFWCADLLTTKDCVPDADPVNVGVTTCYTKFDGFYAETILLTIFAALWLRWGRNQVYNLEKLNASAWIVERKKSILRDDEKLAALTC